MPAFPRFPSRFLPVVALVGAMCVGARISAEENSVSPENKESGVQWNSINRTSLRAVIQPANDVRLSSRAAGIIKRYDAEEGQTVKSGDPILALDDDQEKAELSQAESLLQGAQAELGHAEREFERAKPLTDERIYSDKQLSEATYVRETARSRLAQAQAAVDLARVRLANRTITAPFTGIFLKKTKNIGESVERFEPVARIVDLSFLEIVLFCDASLFDTLRKQTEVSLQVSKSDDRHVVVRGRVTYVDPIIDPASGTFRIRIRLPNSPDTAPGYTAVLLLQPPPIGDSSK